MGLKHEKDVWAGVVFVLAGVAFAWGATRYEVGNSARMGPGYFPLLLGGLLALLGGVMVVRALLAGPARAERIGPWAWRPLVAIIAANLVFGVALGGLPGVPATGLNVGVYGLTLVACLAGDRFHAKEAVWLATALALLSYLAFVLLLQLPFPVWPAFLRS